MKKEPQIFTQLDAQNVPVDDSTIVALAQDEVVESIVRRVIRQTLYHDMLNETSLTGRKLENVANSIMTNVVEYLYDPDLRAAYETQGALTFKVEAKLPPSVKWLRDVIVELIPSDEFNSDAAYEFDLDATDEQRETSDIVLRLHLPQDYQDKEIERFGIEIESDLRHELDHTGQSTDVLMDVQRKVPDSEIWKTIERAKDYYTSQAEIPAYVSGLVLKSKRRGMQAADVIDKELYNIYATGMDYGYSEKELSPLMTRVREMWQYYLMTRWPEQDWPLEFRPDEEL